MLGPVSYTHLDVYKRQSMQSDQLSSDHRWILMLRKQLKDAEIEIAAQLATTTVTLGQILKMKTGAVSYTHLDVYKRQILYCAGRR